MEGRDKRDQKKTHEDLGNKTNSKEEFEVLLGYFGLLWNTWKMYVLGKCILPLTHCHVTQMELKMIIV